MAAFIREGLWIPLLFLIGAILCALWAIYRNLDRIRGRGREGDGALEAALLPYQIALRRIQEAASWIDEGRLDEAVQELKAVERSQPGIPAVDFFLGKAYLSKGEKTLAKEHLERFLMHARPYDQISRERVRQAEAYLEGLR
jgi:tetratricopeptide (TPR) repeat protein